MIDEQVDRRIRAALDHRLSEAAPGTQSDPVEAVRTRVSRRRRRRRGAGVLAAVAAVVLAGTAIVLTVPGDGAEDVETAGPGPSGEDRDAGTADDFRDGVERPYEGLDEESLLAEGDFDSQSYRISVQTESDDEVEVSRYCIGIGATGCETRPDASAFTVVLVDGAPPPAYVAFQVPAGIDAVQIRWEDGTTERAAVVRPVAEDALGFAAAFMPRARTDFSYIGLDRDGTPVTDRRQRPPVLATPTEPGS